MTQPSPPPDASSKPTPWLTIGGIFLGLVVLSKSASSSTTAAIVGVPAAVLVALMISGRWRASLGVKLLVGGLLFASMGGGAMGALGRVTRCQSSKQAAHFLVTEDKLAKAVEAARDAREACGTGDLGELDALEEEIAVAGRAREARQETAVAAIGASRAPARTPMDESAPSPSSPAMAPPSATAAPAAASRADAAEVLKELQVLARIGDQMARLRRTFEQAQASPADAASQGECTRLMREHRPRAEAVRERAATLPDAVSSLRLAASAMTGFLVCTDIADEMGKQVREGLRDGQRDLARARW